MKKKDRFYDALFKLLNKSSFNFLTSILSALLWISVMTFFIIRACNG